MDDHPAVNTAALGRGRLLLSAAVIIGLTLLLWTGIKLVTGDSSATTAAQTVEQDVVPAASAPTIDGSFAEGEWDAALSSRMSDGAVLFLQHSDDTLYLAVHSAAIGAVNVAIAIDDGVEILHSSAALGSARYLRSDTNWELAHGFTWCCRGTSDQSGRNALMATEGWQANIGFAGDPGVVEYAISRPWRGALLAVSSIRDEDDRDFWPAELSTAARGQLVGPPPPERVFNMDEWFRLESGS